MRCQRWEHWRAHKKQPDGGVKKLQFREDWFVFSCRKWKGVIEHSISFIQGEHEVDCHLQIWYAETELSIVCTGRSGNISWAAGSRQVLKLNGCEWTWTWMIHGICQSAPTHCWAQSILTFDIPNMSICVTLGWCMFFALYLADLRAPKFFPDTRVLRANLWCVRSTQSYYKQILKMRFLWCWDARRPSPAALRLLHSLVCVLKWCGKLQASQTCQVQSLNFW